MLYKLQTPWYMLYAIPQFFPYSELWALRAPDLNVACSQARIPSNFLIIRLLPLKT